MAQGRGSARSIESGSTEPDAAELFRHVDAAVALLARAAGHLGAAGTIPSPNTGGSPVDSFTRFGQHWKVRRLVKMLRPHLEAIDRIHAEARTWLARPELSQVGSPWLIIADLVTDFCGNVGGAAIDSTVVNRVEGQRVELSALLDEMAALHARLRQVLGITHGEASALGGTIPDVRDRRRLWSFWFWMFWIALFAAWCGFIYFMSA
jgi:hypothetical protein